MCFLGGSLALGARNGMSPEFLEIGKALTETCWEMYRRQATGLSPEIVYFNTIPGGGRDDMFVKVCYFNTIPVGGRALFIFIYFITIYITYLCYTSI